MKIEKINEKKKSAKPLRRELELYRENGVSLYLNGAPSTPKKSQKPVRLRKTGSICGIIRKMKTAISPV